MNSNIKLKINKKYQINKNNAQKTSLKNRILINNKGVREDRETKKPVYRTKVTPKEKRQLWDVAYAQNKSLKYSILQSTNMPPIEFQKIPKVPITLMNSTMNNKRIQSQILFKSKQTVLEHAQDATIVSNTMQDLAVREILDAYHTQFNFRSALEAKKKKKIIDLKNQYMKELFIKNAESRKTPEIHEHKDIKKLNTTKQTQLELPEDRQKTRMTFFEFIDQLKLKKVYQGFMTSYL
ncbi:hypothetical protein pb186bvf_002300 [Paramecium bursaria]